MDAPATKTSPVSTGPVSKGGSDVHQFGTLGNYVNQKLGTAILLGREEVIKKVMLERQPSGR